MTEKDKKWLDEEELSSFVSLMGVTIRLTNILDAQLRDDADLSFFEYTVLSRLSESENREMRMRDLAYTANGSLSRLSQVVTRLEKQGWVTRRPDPNDGRTTLAQLTDMRLGKGCRHRAWARRPGASFRDGQPHSHAGAPAQPDQRSHPRGHRER